nr:hypothetical protein [Tanacetum cinerariifolium]
MEILLEPTSNKLLVGPYALSWKLCQGDSLNLPDHRTHTLIWRNTTDLEEQSLDDLFNNLKIYEAEVKSSSSASTSTQNIDFVSSSNTDSTNEPISDAGSIFAISAKLHVSALPNVDTLSSAIIYLFFSSQSNSPQLDNDDLKQIDADDLEEMDLKWQMAMLTVEYYNCHRKRHFTRKCRSPKDTRRNDAAEPQRRNVPVETSTLNALVSQYDGFLVKAYATLQSNYDNLTDDNRKSQFDVISYKTRLESVEARLLIYQQNESVFEEDIKLLKLEVQLRDSALVVLRENLEKAEQERDGLKLKLKNLPPSPIYDRYQSGDRYHGVPPTYTGTFMPPKPDLVFHNAPNAVETVHTAFNDELSPTKPAKDFFVQPNEQVKPPRPFVKPVETSILVSNPKTAIPKPKSKGNSRNRKACFVYESLTYLIKDYDFYEKTMAQTTARNHATRGNHKQYAKMTLPNQQTHVVPTTVITKSKLVPIPAARPVTTVVLKCHVTRPRLAKPIVTKPHSPPGRHINRSPSSTASNFPLKFIAVKAPMEKGVIDSGCSRHMTGNMSYLSDFEELNDGYLVVIQRVMCDKKNSVLFTDTECLVLSPEFKLPENQVLLRVPKENNMYNINLKNIVPSGDLTCLFGKATLDESNLWHRRLGHINFKKINKLVKGNLVRGLPSKVFKNDHTCVACKKGKQHRASCSRFTWVFFLATKDETSPIIKTFITGLENQLSLKVKIIRSDNGTELKINDLNQFCGMKGIKREFSVSRTPQQNGIAKRKNRTLIEAARTMLADLLLPIPFWAKAVNTACYVQNRVLVTKPQIKTPYELLHGRTPSIVFMRPFGYPVTILNILDSLGKFDGKVDEGYLVRYSVSSSGPTWLFDIDTLTKTMNYQPFTISNQSNPSTSVQEQFDAKKAGEEIIQQYVLFPVWSSGSNNPQNTDEDAAFNEKEPEFEGRKPESEVNVSLSSILEDITYSDDEDDVGAEADFTNLETSITVSPIPTRVHKDHPVTQIIGDLSSATQTTSMSRVAQDQGGLSQINNDDFHTCMFACFFSQEELKRVHQALKDPIWIEAIQEELLQFKMQKGFRNKKDEIVARIEAIRLFLAYASFIGFMVYQMDAKNAFQYGTIKEEVYVCQPLGFEDPYYPNKVYKVVKALDGLHQAHRACFTDRKSASTPIDTEKPLLKDPDVAYSDSDYAGASLDRKSTTGGCQFLKCRLISWQCKKKTVVATSSTEAEYVAAASCCAKVLWIQNQLLDYG